ncbi:hypothetical protein DL766_009912 [Monosporascus sp. MC13-8B]|nr:hypothetical protein DL766_009912 [Monosporascus sp. MC13-8B]
MGHQLATAPSHAQKFRVLGMIFIDSAYPRYLADEHKVELPLPSEPIAKTPEEMETMKLKEKVDLNMTHARMMVQHWDLPKPVGDGDGTTPIRQLCDSMVRMTASSWQEDVNMVHAPDMLRMLPILSSGGSYFTPKIKRFGPPAMQTRGTCIGIPCSMDKDITTICNANILISYRNSTITPRRAGSSRLQREPSRVYAMRCYFVTQQWCPESFEYEPGNPRSSPFAEYALECEHTARVLRLLPKLYFDLQIPSEIALKLYSRSGSWLAFLRMH